MRLMFRRQRGVTLLESMIAIVLVALGVLGILGVQLRTLSDTQTAVRRAQAIRLIEDLSERMKANPAALTTAVLTNYTAGWGAISTTPPNCATATGCAPTDMALADIAQWKANVAATMPLGDAVVFAVAPNTASNVRTQLGVMISWRENEREGADAAETQAYKAPFAQPTVSTGAASGTTTVSCPDNRICHLQYLQPTLRCMPYSAGDAANPALYCP